MNILQVTLGFYPAEAWGGPIRVVYQNSRELGRRGHRVTVYCTNLLDKKNKIHLGTFEREIDGIRVVYFDTWNMSRWPGVLGPTWMPHLPAYLKREITGFDIVHLNGYRSPLMLLTAKAARKASIPIITQPHGGLPIISNSLWLKRIYDWLLGSMEIKGISALIAFHDIERRQALAHGIPEECVEIIPNGIECSGSVELPEAGIFRRRFGLADDKPLILFLGRVNKIKGTDMLIHAFARLENLNAQMVIAGPDDGQMGQVKSLIHRYNLGNRVSVIGPLSDIDKVAAFQDSDLFVLPSRYDAFPTTIMEACLRGIPMVITDRCGSANLVRDRVAEVVPFDAEAFASAMQRLLTDRELYNRFRDNCHAIITDTFSIGTVIDRLEKVYRRVISEKKERKI